MIGGMDELGSQLADYFRGKAPEVVSAYLFGSRAAGRQHRDSDIDIAVFFDRDRLPRRRDRSWAAVEMSSDLIALSHCNEVDVVVLNDATPELAREATENGVRVFCGDEETDRRFRLQTKLRYIDLIPFLRRNRRIKAETLRS